MKEKISDSLRFFLFLVCPDDSTEKYSGPDKAYSPKTYQISAFNLPEYIGKIKAVFWIITSVLLAMAIAQLN